MRQTSAFNLNDVAEATALSAKDAKKAASFLSSLGLAGLTIPEDLHYGNESEDVVFLTGRGEQLMREVEDRLEEQLKSAPQSTGGKITAAIYSFTFDIGKGVITKVLADILSGKH